MHGTFFCDFPGFPVLVGTLHSKRRPKIGFQYQLSLNAGQKYCRMLQGEHSAIPLTFIKLPFFIKTFVLSIFKWLLKTGFQGYRLNFFRQEQAWPLKQNDWGPSPKLWGPGFGGNSFIHKCQAFALLIIDIRDHQNLHSFNYLPY